MHDCPTCGVPLHGHEEACPSCGARQYVRKGSHMLSSVQKAPGVNLIPVFVIIVVIGIGLFVLAQFTWIGQLMREGPRPEDPMEKMTYQEARQIIETKITEGLTAAGATGKFEWKVGEQPADKMSPQPLQLAVETELADPNQRKAVIDPVKDYMEKAKIPTLTMTDTKSHATWTYTVSPAQSTASPGEEPVPTE